ncbi:MAG: hypothetical protein LW826_01220 [Candidatus Jidaibacter sp.]|jgi:uncharacterized protein Veg|nr:hypothetical protein [Candidatus Jidaibacter sp.]
MKDPIHQIKITLTTSKGDIKELVLSNDLSEGPSTEYTIQSTDQIAVKIALITYIMPVRWPGLQGKTFNWDTFLNTDILTDNAQIVTKDQLTQIRNMLAAHKGKEASERP